MCNWDQELAPTHSLLFRGGAANAAGGPGIDDPLPATTPPLLESRMPPWLERVSLTTGNEAATIAAADVDTLFALRDFMLQEALNVVKFA